LQSFEKAVLLQPQNIDAKYYKGLALAAQNRSQEALLAFEGVLEMDPENSFARYAINLTQARLSDMA
jgi:cytochrome c-type biogenesis protein CcmH/NrfG